MPNLATYIDIGSSRWLRKRHALKLLSRAGVRHIRGFALNTTHFYYTKEQIRYGNALARKLGKRYVVNTAENGHGGLEERKERQGPLLQPGQRRARPAADHAHRLQVRRRLPLDLTPRPVVERPRRPEPVQPRPRRQRLLAAEGASGGAAGVFHGQPPWPPAPL